jgi:branched-chain amino acid transport system substrate-binding protein
MKFKGDHLMKIAKKISSFLQGAMGQLVLFAACLQAPLHSAQYDVGATDDEIRIGCTAPLSGPIANLAAVMSKTAMAYFEKINLEQGGVNGRKVLFIIKDDAYDPRKTVELTRELVENERVLFTFLSVGTATNMAVKDFLNFRKIPQLFVTVGPDDFFDPVKSPWTLPLVPKYSIETKQLAEYLLKNKPDAKIGALYLNTDGNKAFFNGFKKALGAKSDSMIVKAVMANVTDPSVQTQIQVLRNSKADTFFCPVLGKLAVSALQLAYDSGWKPFTLIYSYSLTEQEEAQIGSEKLIGVVAAGIFKDLSNPRWKEDKGIKDYVEFMKKYYPSGNPNCRYCFLGYFGAQLMVDILKTAGDVLTRENIMNIATNLNYSSADFPVLLPGIKLHTTPTNYAMFENMILQRYEGHFWDLLEKP